MKRRYVANLKFPTLFFFSFFGKKRVSVRLVLESVQVPRYYSEDSEGSRVEERKERRGREDKSGSGRYLVVLVFGMYKVSKREREGVCVCVYVCVCVRMVYIKCRNSDPIFTRYLSQIPSLNLRTYELLIY